MVNNKKDEDKGQISSLSDVYRKAVEVLNSDNLVDIRQINIYDYMTGEQFISLASLVNYKGLRPSSLIPFPPNSNILSYKGKTLMFLPTAIVATGQKIDYDDLDVFDPTPNIGATLLQHETNYYMNAHIQEQYGEIISDEVDMWNYGKVTAVSKRRTEEDTILENLKGQPFKMVPLKFIDGDIKTFVKTNGIDSLIVTPRTELINAILKPIITVVKMKKINAPTFEEKTNTTAEVNRMIAETNKLADIYLSKKSVMHTSFKNVNFSKLLTKAIFKERGIDVKDFSKIDDNIIYGIYKVNNMALEVFPKSVRKTFNDHTKKLAQKLLELDDVIREDFDVAKQAPYISHQKGLYYKLGDYDDNENKQTGWTEINAKVSSKNINLRTNGKNIHVTPKSLDDYLNDRQPNGKANHKKRRK